jgi:[acyl-carrier-protein] S-malonyltransferase
MLVIVAPGQGSQKPGLLADWLTLDGAAETITAQSAASGLNLTELGTTADEAAVTDTAHAQPLLVALGLLAGQALRGDGPPADVYAGHSVGELTVTGLSGILDPSEAVRLAARRGQEMAAAATLQPTGLSAVVGGAADEVEASLRATGLEVANYNGAGQLVAGGLRNRLADLSPHLPPHSRAISLAVSGAFHTSFMAPAVPHMAVAVDGLVPNDPITVVLSNLDGAAVTSGADLLARLVLQVTHSVRWDRCQDSMLRLGVTGLLELPPAKALTSIAKRHLAGVERFSLNSPDQLDEARTFCARHAGRQPQEVHP